MAYSFKRRESVRTGFRRIAAEQCDSIAAHLTGGDTPDVHEARKCCKMLRALLRLFRDAIDRAEATALGHKVRDIARHLGPARDAEVRRHTFDQLLAAHPGCDPRPFSVVSRALNIEVHAIRRHGLSAAILKRCVRGIGTVRKRICALDLRGHGWEAIGRGLHRAYARARRPLRDASALTDAARHTWRKDIKTLWYHTRLLAGVCGKKMSGLSDDLDSLGELFGEDRDLAVLAAHLRRGLLRDAPPRVSEPLFALIGESRAKLFRTGRDKAAALLDETPRVFARRIGKWWHAGRG